MKMDKSDIMLGALGAVGGEAIKTLIEMNQVKEIISLGRKIINGLLDSKVNQQLVDVLDPDTYAQLLQGQDVAICALGVGQPSKISREQFIKIDKDAVLNFAATCKKKGVKHFQLLSSVGISDQSSSFFLKIKSELVEALKSLSFERLSIFQSSMIFTPKNRYGLSQGIILKIWSLFNPLLIRKLKKYRGIKVEQLGKSIGLNIYKKGKKLRC